ncbi:PHD finger protein 14 [Linnemannia zychae]|nr:PHD finger protein 14 [Linnemannia zychae]
MVPPQYCPPAFTLEFSGMPMMMAIMEPQQQQQQQQQDVTPSSRPGLAVKAAEPHSSQPFIPPGDEDKDRDKDKGGDPAPSMQASSSPDIILPSDDQSISLVENSNPPQAHNQHTTQPAHSQSQSSPTQQNQSMRPQRQRRSTANHNHSNPGHSPTVTKGSKATPTSNASRSPVIPPAAAIPAVIAPPTMAVPVAPTEAQTTAPLLYTPVVTATTPPAPYPQQQRHIFPSDDLPPSNPPAIEHAASPQSTRFGKRPNPDSDEGATDPAMVETQTQEAENVGSDVSTEKGVQLEKEIPSLDPNSTAATTLSTLLDEDSSNAQGVAEPDPMGAGLKRESRPVRSVGPQGTALSKGKDTSGMPAKKRAKTEQAKKNENDTASLFQKIFADRDPGKRKIKTKSVHEIPIDLAADEDDSDFEDTKINSNDEDEDMVMPEDAVSEDELQPSQQEAFNDEQELLTALWQWKDNDPEVCCVCLGRSTEADNVFVYCDTLDCALCVHQACYGVKTLPSESEPWLCDRCKAPPEEVVSCVCCPSKDGAFRRLIPEDPSGGWVHVVCALWLPETTLGDPENVDRISVRDIPEKNWNLACYMCPDPQDAAMGACVQCDAGQCRKSFHITCAQSYSLLETIEDSDMADPYFTYCKQHGSADGQSKLNGWAKWVKQRDAFLKRWQNEQGLKRTQRLVDIQQSGIADEDGGEGLIEFFEHSYSRFKQAREKRIAQERSELSRQYSIGYYLGNKIDKSRSRLDVISSKAQQAQQEQRRIEMHTRNLLSSLLECAHYLENVSAEQLEAPLSIDTTLAWYNALPDTSRWKSNIQDIIETIDISSLSCDNPYSHPGVHGQVDSSLDDSESGQRHGRSSKSIYGKLSKKGGKATFGTGKNVKSKKVHPKPTLANKNHIPVVFTSSRGRLIKRDFSDPDEYYSTGKPNGNFGPGYHHGQSLSQSQAARVSKTIVPCSVCHQLTLPEEKLALERDEDGMLTPMAIKVLNRMVTCDTCQRQFHPKCLNPPMSRAPPRGYSWNCEDCDSSEDSQQGSSGEASPTLANSHQHHHHSLSSDLDEALMVLADTAMTVSASNSDYLPPVHARSGERPLSHGLKRPLTYQGQDAPESVSFPASSTDGPSKGKAKKMKMEAVKPKAKGVAGENAKLGPKTKKVAKPKANSADPEAGEQQRQIISPKPGMIAPIIRGNLRIYPPGPNTIAPKFNPLLLKEVKVEQPATVIKPKAGSKKVKVVLPSGVTKQESATGTIPKKKAPTDTAAKATKSKKNDTLAPPTKGKAAAAAVTPKKKAIAIKDATPPAATKTVKATKEKPAAIRRGSLPAVPEPPPPKAKDVIRYTVGEKTVEELTAKEDVEIERRDNVKFRKLRGRTLTMPAAPQEVLENQAILQAQALAQAQAQAQAQAVAGSEPNGVAVVLPSTAV